MNIRYTFTPIDADGNELEPVNTIMPDGEPFAIELPDGSMLGICATATHDEMTALEYATFAARCDVVRVEP